MGSERLRDRVGLPDVHLRTTAAHLTRAGVGIGLRRDPPFGVSLASRMGLT
jgi:hypothetical protein